MSSGPNSASSSLPVSLSLSSRHWTCHSERFLYMLLEYVCGGELFSYLRNAVKFSNDTAVFYAAEITSALEYLHSLSIIYRSVEIFDEPV